MISLTSMFFLLALALLAQGQETIPLVGLSYGINPNTGERPVRRNINEMHAEGGPEWDLYMLGLTALQNKTEDDPVSHFGIAAIHGLPFIPYNGVEGVENTTWKAYSPHSETMFPAWHRAYVAFYEQFLGQEIVKISNRYIGENATAYIAAGQSFRQPYWDWSADAFLPPACIDQFVAVNGPRGPVTIRNPLYSYAWQHYPLDQDLFPNSEDWPDETTRQPSETDNTTTFQPDYINTNLSVAAETIRERVYRTFTTTNKYEVMASMTIFGSSFEAPHNDIHNILGGSFADLSLSAFDPLFVPLHANIDRLFALWTAIYYDSAVQTQPYNTPGQFATEAGTTITADSPLKPFYRDNSSIDEDGDDDDENNFHTSRSIASPSIFGYTYAELGPWDLDREQSAKNARVQVNRLYGDSVRERRRRRRRRSTSIITTTTRGSRNRRLHHEAQILRQGQNNDDDNNNNNNNTTFSSPAAATWTDWILAVELERSEAQPPSSVNVYVGDVLVGRTLLLNMPMCGLLHDEVPLSHAVVGLTTPYGDDDDDDDDDDDVICMEKVLGEEIRVEIQKNDGTLVDLATVPSLRLDLQYQDVTAPASETEFPKYGNKTTSSRVSGRYLIEKTKGRFA